MLKNKNFRRLPTRGFTIIELLIVAPIVILTIGAFVTVIVSMTGEVLATRSSNALAYSIQDALNRIEEDVKLSTTFLEANNVTPLTSGQGYDDNTADFSNVDATKGNMLILNTLATTGNPLASTSGLIYLSNLAPSNQPNTCASSQVNQNAPMTMNIIYFVKDSKLWRRTVAPSTYLTAGCSIPWQQPSCTSIDTNPGFCKTQDVLLVDDINPSGFTVQYFNTADATAANSVASDVNESPANRYAALQSTATVGATINVTKTTAGRNVSQGGTIRATKLDINASTIAAVEPPPTAPTVAPTVTASISNPASAVFAWPTVPGASTYTIDYNINGGAWVNGFANSSATTYTVNAVHNDTVNARVSATNSFGPSAYGTDSITIPPWTNILMQNNWTDYGNTYSTGAYTKTSGGVVVLKGLLKRSGTSVAYENVGVLPPGYRPAGKLIFHTSTSANVTARVDVNTNGDIECGTCNGGWVSLDGIKFLPTGSPYPITAPTLLNGWVNYAGGHEVAGYAVDGNGRTHIQGLVTGGTTTNGTDIFVLPAALQTNQYHHFPVVITPNVFGYLGTSNGAYNVEAKGNPATGWLSVTNMFYPGSYTGWTNLTLQNAWVWYGTIYTTPQYTKAADGIVSLKGLIKSGTATSGTVLATLPAGYRPKERLLLGVVNNGAYARVDILANGNVIAGGAVSNIWLSLDGINFIAEQ